MNTLEFTEITTVAPGGVMEQPVVGVCDRSRMGKGEDLKRSDCEARHRQPVQSFSSELSDVLQGLNCRSLVNFC